MVRGAVRYLWSTFDHDVQVWRIAPGETVDYPHAPCWDDQDGSRVRLFEGFVINPRAEIVALLHHYSPLVPSDWLDDVTESAVDDIETIATLGTGGADELFQALSLSESEPVPNRLRDRVVARVLDVVPADVTRDLERWGTYCIPPLRLATTPCSIVAGLLWDDLQVNLAYEIGPGIRGIMGSGVDLGWPLSGGMRASQTGVARQSDAQYSDDTARLWADCRATCGRVRRPLACG